MKILKQGIMVIVACLCILLPSVSVNARVDSYDSYAALQVDNDNSTLDTLYYERDSSSPSQFGWPSGQVNFETSKNMTFAGSMVIPSNVSIKCGKNLKIDRDGSGNTNYLTIKGTFELNGENSEVLLASGCKITVEDGGRLIINKGSVDGAFIEIMEGGKLEIKESFDVCLDGTLKMLGGKVIAAESNNSPYLTIHGSLSGLERTEIDCIVEFAATTVMDFGGETTYFPRISGHLTFNEDVRFGGTEGAVIIDTDGFPIFKKSVGTGKLIIECKNYSITGTNASNRINLSSSMLVVSYHANVTIGDNVALGGFDVEQDGILTIAPQISGLKIEPYLQGLNGDTLIVENGGKLIIGEGKQVDILKPIKIDGEVIISDNTTLMSRGAALTGNGKITGNGKLYLNTNYAGTVTATVADTISIASTITVLPTPAPDNPDDPDDPVNPPTHQHEYTITVTAEIPATCSVKGKTAVKKCSKCDATIGGEDIDMIDHTIEETIKAASTKADGSIVKACKVCHKEISKVVIDRAYVTIEDTAKYTGKAIKQAVKVTDASGKKIDKKYYTVTYKNNIKVGKATATVTFNDFYKGSVNKTFTIVNKSDIPAKVSGLKLTGGKKAISVSWKNAKNADGYEIQYSTDKNFLTAVKTVKITKADTLTKSISKLKAKTTYYVRIRAYNKEGKTTAYSAWATKKSVKTK